MHFVKYRSPLLLFLLILTQNVFAVGSIGSIPQVINDSIYILELVVIAIVAIALIVLTLSIARSRRKISDMVTEIQNEMNDERAVLAMTVKSIKEKEKQVSYMAHLLQIHLENNDIESSNSKKKIINEVIIEIIDDASELQEYSKETLSSLLDTKKETVENPSIKNNIVDSRTIAADGKVKQAHFGPDQYIADIHSYQYQVYERVQCSVKQADQCLSDLLSDIRSEMKLVKVERTKLRDFIIAIQSNIRSSDPQRINSKDRKIVQKLSLIDERLKILENSHQAIDKHYKETMLKLKKYTVDLSEDTVEVLDASPA